MRRSGPGRGISGVLVALVALSAWSLSACSADGGGGSAGAQRTAGDPARSGSSCLPPVGSAPVGSGAVGSAAAAPSGADGAALPDVTLPCFVGGHPVRLAQLGAPAVINLWASWCAPCRTELPQVQRYADRTAGRVLVIGVITEDPVRSRPASLIDDLGLRFPMLTDSSAGLQRAVGGQVLPMTLLVDAQGRVAYRYAARPLDAEALADLVERYLRVPA
jgi:thiol-disulfide isomerase/thioredoxin